MTTANLYFTLCKCVQYAYRAKDLLRLNMHRRHSISKEDTENQPLRFAFSKIHRPWYGHFAWLSCRGRQRNVPRFKTHVHSHCSAHQTFCLFWCRFCRRRRRGRGLLRLPNRFCQRIRLIMTQAPSTRHGVRLSSTLQRRERSPKTESFKNALRSGAN